MNAYKLHEWRYFTCFYHNQKHNFLFHIRNISFKVSFLGITDDKNMTCRDLWIVSSELYRMSSYNENIPLKLVDIT